MACRVLGDGDRLRIECDECAPDLYGRPAAVRFASHGISLGELCRLLDAHERLHADTPIPYQLVSSRGMN